MSKPPEIYTKLSPVDKIARHFPAWARSRHENRLKIAMLGGYDAAAKTGAIFENFVTSVTDADGAVADGDRLKIIERDRQLVRNFPVATGLIKRVCDHAIGSRGLSLHPQINNKILGWDDQKATDWQDEAESLWREWSESQESDLARTQNFQQKTYLTLQSMLEGGDCFSIMTNLPRPGSGFNLKIQTIEGERVNNENYGQDTADRIEGIVKDQYGAPEKIQISNIVPDDYTKNEEITWEEKDIFDPKTGRRNILQHYNLLRPGQTRGVPILGPVTDKLLQLGRLSNAELLAAVINAFYTIVIKGDPANTKQVLKSPASLGSTTEATTTSSNDKVALGHGNIIRLNNSGDTKTDFDSFDPQRPNHLFAPFFNAMVAEIGAGVGVPKSLILMVFDKSYSASRGEVLLAWAYFLAKRTDTAVGLCQPVYEAFLDEMIAAGRLAAPGYFENSRVRKAFRGSAYEQWTGPTRPAIDELKEAQAFALYNQMGAKSLQDIIAEISGKDFMRVFEQLKHEHDLRVKAGLETDTGLFANSNQRNDDTAASQEVLDWGKI